MAGLLTAAPTDRRQPDACLHQVDVTEADGVLDLKVIDDGGGFDPSAPRTGFGLTGMRERALLLDGDFEVTSTADGTCVSARLPTGQRL